MVMVPLVLVYKDGDVWRPLKSDDASGKEIAFLITQERMPVTVEFGGASYSFSRDSKGNIKSK